MARLLTIDETTILEHEVLDPAAWWAHAQERLGADAEIALAAKIRRIRPGYDAVKNDVGYLTRAARDAAEIVPPAPPPSKAEIYDRDIQSGPLFKAVLLAINDGSIVPGANAAPADLKAAIVAKM